MSCELPPGADETVDGPLAIAQALAEHKRAPGAVGPMLRLAHAYRDTARQILEPMLLEQCVAVCRDALALDVDDEQRAALERLRSEALERHRTMSAEVGPLPEPPHPDEQAHGERVGDVPLEEPYAEEGELVASADPSPEDVEP